jgi:SulP family sulfate permease
MLVALPAAIAFGVSVYAPLGGDYAAYGAIAGVLGVGIIGIIAPLLGGTSRLISSPSAPAAAVLSAFALEYMRLGIAPKLIFVMLMVVGLLAGIFQLLFGRIGLGQLIKYIPFPVVSGYLTGVGLVIIIAQLPNFFGVPHGGNLWETLRNPYVWQWQSMVIGGMTLLMMVMGDRWFRHFPTVIIAFIVGIITYVILGWCDPSLFLPHSTLIIGAINGEGNFPLLQSIETRLEGIFHFSMAMMEWVLFPALTLATLLSIDTLKTSIVLDSMTHSFSDPNQELMAQGSGNIASAVLGGMSGSGTMGPTMVNLSGGATSNLSGVVEGIMSLIVFALLGKFIGWIPIATLAGILMVVGFRMIDRHSVRLLRSQTTLFDFFIIVIVALTALSVSLIAAAGVGLVLAMVLYLLRQMGESIIYRQLDGYEIKSKIIRSHTKETLLEAQGGMLSVYELQGSLFFGTAHQLYGRLKIDLPDKKYIILDMKRVETVDLTAAHLLLQIKDILHDKGGYLLLSRLPHKLPTGEDLERYFHHVGVLKHLSPAMIFNDLDEAVEWVEEDILRDNHCEIVPQGILSLSDFDLFKERHSDTLEEIEKLLECQWYKKGERIYSQGDSTGEMFLIRQGRVRIVLPSSHGETDIHLGTYEQGNFFGEFSFLEGTSHYTHSIAQSNTQVYRITREAFDLFAQHHKKASLHFMQSLATVLAQRLRLTRSKLGDEV